MPVIPYHKSSIDKDTPWDAGANTKRLKSDQPQSYYDLMFAWRPDGDDIPKSEYKFPHHIVSADGAIGSASMKALSSVVAALNGARTPTTIPADDKQGVYNHIKKHYQDAGVEPKDIPELKMLDADDDDEPEEDKRFKKNKVEYRTAEIRAADITDPSIQGTPIKTLEGRAIVFDALAPIFMDMDGTQYYETIDEHALDGVDLSNVILKYNHSDHVPPLASTKNQSLDLAVGTWGLDVKAKLANTSQANDIHELVRTGVLDKMSFKFTVADDSYNAKTKTRTIHQFGSIYDVSVVDFPAYEGTTVTARSYFTEQEKEVKKKNKKEKRKKRKVKQIQKLISKVSES